MRHLIQINFISDPHLYYLGGRNRLYLENLKTFLLKLRELADLVFCFAGRGVNGEVIRFVPKAECTYQKNRKLYAQFETRENVANFKMHAERKMKGELDATNTLNDDLLEICENIGQIQMFYHRFYPEMGKYVMENEGKVLAVLTYNEYFLPIQGNFQFWLLIKFDVETFQVIRYNRSKLFDVLQMKPKHLMLLSSITSRNRFPVAAFDRFKRKICHARTRGEQHMKYLIEYIRSFQLQENGSIDDPRTLFPLEILLKDIFGDEFSKQDENIIINRFKFWVLNFEIDESGSNEHYLKQIKMKHPFLYKLMTDELIYLKDNSFLSFDLCKNKTYTEMSLLIIRKMLGIIFKNDSDRPTHRMICAKHQYVEPAKLALEEIIYPESMYEIDRNFLIYIKFFIFTSGIVKCKRADSK